jgi:diguanylate cyclase (GGDEF)-like protein
MGAVVDIRSGVRDGGVADGGAEVPVAGLDTLFGAFNHGRRGGDDSFRADVRQSFNDDPQVSSAKRILENSDCLSPEVVGIIKSFLDRVSQVYLLEKQNNVLRGTIDSLRVVASFDELTGLLNQQAFRAYGNKMFDHAAHNGGRIALVAGDVDFFKRVNDSHGHAAGDEVLRSVGGIVRGTVRNFDVPGRDGGEEFGIILPGTDLDGACTFAERLRRRIESTDFTFNGDDRPHPVTMSFGVAVRDCADGTFDDLKARADRGLYAAKNEHGRNAVVLAPVAYMGGSLRCVSPQDRFRYAEDERGSYGLCSSVGALVRRVFANVR